MRLIDVAAKVARLKAAPLAGSFASTPSISTRVWLLSEPRRRTSVRPPSGPVCDTFKLGSMRSNSAGSKVMRWEKSSTSNTDTELPTRRAGVGVWCATTIISSIAASSRSSLFAAMAAELASKAIGRVRGVTNAWNARELRLIMRHPMLRSAMVNQELSRV